MTDLAKMLVFLLLLVAATKMEARASKFITFKQARNMWETRRACLNVLKGTADIYEGIKGNLPTTTKEAAAYHAFNAYITEFQRCLFNAQVKLANPDQTENQEK